jgi:hypothetical protein
MVPAFFVIDDFLRNAEEVRKQALSMTYAVGGRYPGLNSTQKLRIEGLDEVVSQLVRTPLKAPWTDDFSHGSCRIALASHEQEARIHIDQSHWSGILYLSRHEDCQGGTEFFRHKRTNTDRLPMDEESQKAANYASYEELQKEILDKDALDRSKWEHTMTVPMRYNRLVLLQPHYWHTAGPGFGDSLENGRLIYLMFFLRA